MILLRVMFHILLPKQPFLRTWIIKYIYIYKYENRDNQTHYDIVITYILDFRMSNTVLWTVYPSKAKFAGVNEQAEVLRWLTNTKNLWHAIEDDVKGYK